MLKNKKYFLISVIVYIIFLSFMIEVSKEAGERKMDIGFIGLGKMGLNMALNVHEQGWPIIGFDVTKEARATAREQGLSVVDSLSELLKALNKRKVIFKYPRWSDYQSISGRIGRAISTRGYHCG